MSSPDNGSLVCALCLCGERRRHVTARPCRSMEPDSHEVHQRAEQLHPRLLAEARRVRGAEEGARDGAERRHRAGEGLGSARARRSGVSHRHEVAVRVAGHAAAEIHRVQRGRKRTGHVQGPRPDGAQPALALRGMPDRLLGDPREGRLHLYPRRVLSRPES